MSEKKDLREELSESVHKVWLAGLGALSTAGEEGSKLFKGLVEKGEAYERRSHERLDEVKAKVEKVADEAKESAEETWDKVESQAETTWDKVETTWDKVEHKVDESVSGALGRFGVPSRDEIATLTKRVEELTSVVEKLKKPAAKKPAAKKPAAKKSAAKKPAAASA